jgi:fatty acyl-CoA reductase
MSAAPATVLITGCTGFVGKVILAELIRRRDELNLGRLLILARPRKGQQASERFEQEIAASPAFSQLPAGWQPLCEPVAGDITLPRLGLAEADYQALAGRLTHVIHSAASVEFNLPLAEAATVNISGALAILALAQAAPQLRNLVDISTAYVTPHPGDLRAIPEALAPLSVGAEATFAAIQAGQADEQALLAQTGHPNTYTLTKSLAEHLLAERKGDVPLTIVRPSIVSACWQYPFPGWIDSRAAFAGFLYLFGAGHLRVLAVDPQTALDIVPCDVVADRAINAAFGAAPDDLTIRYAVAGPAFAQQNTRIITAMSRYFGSRPQSRPATVKHVGRPGPQSTFATWRHQTLPLWTAEQVQKWKGDARRVKGIRRLRTVLTGLNDQFAAFTQNTFHFTPSQPITDPAFDTTRYLNVVLQGVHRHLLGGDDKAVPLGGKSAALPEGGVPWTLGQPAATKATRLLAYLLEKTLRRGTDLVTVDLSSFEAALAQRKPGEMLVLVPSHRSYLDFLICSYLFFARPSLGIPLPFIAATDDFARIPLVGRILKGAQAFYIRRGLGKADPDLSRRVAELANGGHALQFFIEGTRSRSRRGLPPRRGLLRALQATGQPCLVLPIAISYDQVPEQSGFHLELAGEGQAAGGLGPLLGWAKKLYRGDVSLGRVHVACGQPQPLHADTDVPALSRRVVAELQQHIAVSGYHLRHFLARHPELGLDLHGLSGLITARGGQVLDSDLTPAKTANPIEARCLDSQWLHWFYPEAQAMLGDHPAIARHLADHHFALPSGSAVSPSESLQALVKALVQPIAADYAAVAETLAAGGEWTADTLAAAMPGRFRPDLGAALADLLERGLVAITGGTYRMTGGRPDLETYRDACRWPGSPTNAPVPALVESTGRR